MIRAIIIDDEPQNIKYLTNLLYEIDSSIEIIGTAQNVNQGLALIENQKPGVVFLDVQMKGETGFDLLAKVKNRNFQLIIITAHEKYAMKAIKFAALDFLLKPIHKPDLLEALEKIKSQNDEDSLNKRLTVLEESMSKLAQTKIAVSTKTSLLVINIKDILYCESDGPYTNFYFKDNQDRVMSSTHLKEYEELLSDHGFLRIHKSYLVNLSEIKQYLRTDGGFVVLNREIKLPVSDIRKSELMKAIKKNIHLL